ncbi:hypothetical protein Ae201684P_018407 [Aphanomyces euteiches]|uniref:DDE Tnp4 domain-containing protein n=1 Tax=Aphanomyces euteiches TaxID=100861 RepID=A0A6G0WG01_9STRA|nr:hypothetical protein Ae201684_015796 [Aphanomyces euteiches]KAH9099391.1 hypothetical protein Ae201684P_018407 [Aphanomyces euteiches]
METLVTTSKRFHRFPEALYATDVKFQPANRPSGTFADAKRYFSGKHKLYGYKVDASVSPSGKYLLLSSHRSGAVSDLTMFVDRLETHRINLRKTPTDRQIVDVGEGGTQYPESWAVIMDKGYEGVDDAVRSIRPKKKSRGSILSRMEIDRNERVSSDRVIVENLFGRT